MLRCSNQAFLGGGEIGGERRAAAFEGVEIVLFAVGDAVVPATPQDAYPFECESSHDGMTAFASAFLLPIVCFGPFAKDDGLSGPFHQALAEELGRIPSLMSPDLASAFFTYRSDSSVFLQGGRIRIALE